MASRTARPTADRERIGAVKDIAGTRGVDDIDGIGRLRRFKLPVSYQLTPASPRVTAATRQSKRAIVASASSLGRAGESRRSAGSENTAWSVSGSSASKTLGLGDVAIEYRRNAELARRGRTARRRPPASADRRARRTTPADFVERQPVRLGRKLATEIHDLPFARPIDDDARDRRTTVRKQPELRDVDAFCSERRRASRARRHRRRRVPRTRRCRRAARPRRPRSPPCRRRRSCIPGS